MSWVAPTERTDGSPLTDLAGFRVYYGVDARNRVAVAEVRDPALSSARIAGLLPGTWYFAVSAVDSQGVESELAGPVTKTIG